MTRKECENRIMKLLEKVVEIAKKYDPKTDYLSMAYTLTDKPYKWCLSVNNRYWREDLEHPLNYTKFGDGSTYRRDKG